MLLTIHNLFRSPLYPGSRIPLLWIIFVFFLCTVLAGASAIPSLLHAEEDEDRSGAVKRIDRVRGEVEEESLRRNIFMVGPKKGARIAELVRLHRPVHVVECGTALGYSTLWMARALEHADGGHMTTIELNEQRVAEARQHFEEAGVSDRVRVIQGDAREKMKTIEEPVDVLLLDCGFSNYKPCFDAIRDQLLHGALVIADNAGTGSDAMRDYLQLVRETYPSRNEPHELDLPWADRDALEITRIRNADGPVLAPIGVGASPSVGCRENPRRVERLIIREPGVYENILVDGQWAEKQLVKIQADDVVLRNCEIRNGRHNGIYVDGRNVRIESTRIHHLLRGSSEAPEDAHGITGRPRGLEVRNCVIDRVSGDSIQLDPDRHPWGNVRITNSTFRNTPLARDVAGYNAGDRPGENGLDTKQDPSNERSDVTVKRSLFSGWRGERISNQAAVNLKEHVRGRVIGSVLVDSELAFRLRGNTGSGGAHVEIENVLVDRVKTALRLEDDLPRHRIRRLGIGPAVERTWKTVNTPGRGPEEQHLYRSLPYQQTLTRPLPVPADADGENAK